MLRAARYALLPGAWRWAGAVLVGGLAIMAPASPAPADMDRLGAGERVGPTSPAAPGAVERDRDTRPPVTRHKLKPARPNGRNGTYDSPVRVTLFASDAESGVGHTRYRIDGGKWRIYEGPEETILDRTLQSFAQWRQTGLGFFLPQPDGSIRSYAGIGMLWYPQEEFADMAIRLRWRDGRTDGCCSNSGVFVRFPDPEAAVLRPPQERHPCQSGTIGGVPLAQIRPEWVAIFCGHEIQINDGTSDPQATGSIYNFKPLDLEDARPNKQGEWNDYEIRTVGDEDYVITVIRDGILINQFSNSPGQDAARPGDPPTDQRQFARGFIGLQNHFAGDVIDFRDVRVANLSPHAGAFTISDPGRHIVEYHSIDFAGNVERTKAVTFTIR